MRRVLIVGLILTTAAWTRSPGRRHVLDPITTLWRQQARKARQPATDAVRPDQPIGAVLPDNGQIAVVDESEGVNIPAGFNLDQKALTFTPGGTAASEYSFSVGGSKFDAGAAGSGTALTLDDDEVKEVALPFSFPFYGLRYSSTFVESDGNITFGSPETGDDLHFDRDFVRLVVGPPRAGPLFVDLDPSQPGSVISYVSSSTRFVVTWKNVPLYDDRPGPTVPRQTFQLALYPDGRIEFSWSGVNVTTLDFVPVGIAPGGATRVQQITFVDYATGSTSSFTTAVVQEYTNSAQFDTTAVAPKFYRNHDDAYDFLVVFDTVNRDDVNACAFAMPVRNWVHGIGLRVSSLAVEEFDATSFLGSAGRLQNLIYMGPVSRYPADPSQPLAPGGICGRNSVMTILGQEAGHRFLAYPRFLDPATGQRSSELLGRDLQHWSFYFNSDASLVEGNQIEDKGSGVTPRFETKQIVLRYSALDQYLMGLRAPDDVPGTFFVRNPSVDFPRSHGPQSGILFDGTRLDITLPMIVAAEGRRAPDVTLSPKQFRFAFALLVPTGTTPSQADIDKVDRYRQGWETFFNAAADNRAKADTALVKQLAVSVWPASGIIQGRSITATVTLGAAPAAPVTVSLAAAGGVVTVPASVTVPAGSRSVDFTINGNTVGTAELIVQGPDASYESVRAFLRVRSSTAGLSMDQLSGPLLSGALVVPIRDFPFSGGAGVNLDEQLIFRVRDENFLPYPGLKLNASASGTGSVTPSSLLTDARGWVRINWKLDDNPGTNNLTVTLDGQPDASAKVQAVGVPHPPRRRDPRQ